MKLILLRHGETDWNLEKRIQGTQNVALNELGKKQIEEIREHFFNDYEKTIHRMIASPLRRTVESALICNQRLNLPLEFREEFQERSFGILEGQTVEEIRQSYQIEDVEEVKDARHGIESMDSLSLRLEKGLRNLRETYPQDRILLITHGSIIKEIARHYGKKIGIVKNGTYLEL
ncbi:histidine phosphatase family protein [Ammoniphilus sp. YIM 78166]|uniref:histidine phosphatase family protein n=1 Tax=Ammoniphilus sp. YIM 78166 TaxID=1644106 RepID=UPI00106FD95E|nr:histidine phosphatase family protein [Ammoniphilus sp. YIM 78166]